MENKPRINNPGESGAQRFDFSNCDIPNAPKTLQINIYITDIKNSNTIVYKLLIKHIKSIFNVHKNLNNYINFVYMLNWLNYILYNDF